MKEERSYRDELVGLDVQFYNDGKTRREAMQELLGISKSEEPESQPRTGGFIVSLLRRVRSKIL